MGGGPLTDEALTEAARELRDDYYFACVNPVGLSYKGMCWGVWCPDAWGDGILVHGAATRQEVADWIRAQADERARAAAEAASEAIANLRKRALAAEKVRGLLSASRRTQSC